MNVDNIENMSPCFVIEIIAVYPCCPGRVPRLPVNLRMKPKNNDKTEQHRITKKKSHNNNFSCSLLGLFDSISLLTVVLVSLT